jgi:hypothetical protein
MLGNGLYASDHGVGMIDLKLTLAKIVHLKNVQYVHTINKIQVGRSLLCSDGFKVVLESNKFVVFKCR